MCDHPNREAAMVVIDPGTPERLGRNGVWCDPCLEQLVRALNLGGIRTTASCCGHGAHLGWVMLADGRDLVIADHETHQRIADGISLTATVPDPRFRDQLVEALIDAHLIRWRAVDMALEYIDALMPTIAAEVKARVQAAANQRAAEVLELADVAEGMGITVFANRLRAAALASPAPAPRAEEES